MNSNVLIVVGVLVLMLVLSGGLSNLTNEKLDHENAVVSEEEVRHSELPAEEAEQEAEQEAHQEAEQEAHQEAEQEAHQEAEQEEEELGGLDDDLRALVEEERPSVEEERPSVEEERPSVEEERPSVSCGVSNGKWSVSGWSGEVDYASI
jgi:FtsZ-interacting cell division protein ZipA